MGLSATYAETGESLMNVLIRYHNSSGRRAEIREILEKIDTLPNREKNLKGIIESCREFGYKKELKKVAEVCSRHGYFEQALSLYGLNPGNEKFLKKDDKAVYEIGVEAARQGRQKEALEAFKYANISRVNLTPEFYKTLSLSILDSLRHNQNVKSEEINKEYCNGRNIVKSIDVQNGGNIRKVVINYGNGLGDRFYRKEIVFTYTKQDITDRTQRNAVEFYDVANPFEKEKSVLKFYRDGSDAVMERVFLKALEGLDVPKLISSEDFGDYKLNQFSKIEGEPLADAVKNMSREEKKALFMQAIKTNGKMYEKLRERENFVLEELHKHHSDVEDLTEEYCNNRFLEVIKNLYELGIDDLADKLNEHYKRITDKLVRNARFVVNYDYKPRNMILNHRLAVVDHETYKRGHPTLGCVTLIYNPENGFDGGLREELKQKSVDELVGHGIPAEESKSLWLPFVVFWEARIMRKRLPYLIAGTATEEIKKEVDWYVKDMGKALEEMEK